MARDPRLREQRATPCRRRLLDIHVALAQAVSGNDAALEERARQVDELTHKGRYPSGLRAACRTLRRFRTRDFTAAIDALQPIAGELERLGGSRAQPTWWSSRC